MNSLLTFFVMFLIGITLNPMNLLAYRLNDLYLSTTLIYGGLIMASNMVWSHELLHYYYYKTMNTNVFILGILLFLLLTSIIRSQLFVDDKNWLKRMISHHSTALTTSNYIYSHTKDPQIRRLSKEIIDTQEKEINEMKSMLSQTNDQMCETI